MGMVSDGELRRKDGTVFRFTISHSKNEAELVISYNNQVVSSYKKTKDMEYAYNNKEARRIYKTIEKGLKGCNSKNGFPTPFVMGTSITHNVSKQNTEYTIEKFNNAICSLELSNEEEYIYTEFKGENAPLIPKEIPYIKLASSSINYTNTSNEDEITVRSLEEIALEKDLTWLENKKYYIVNDEETAERIFNYIENYKGIVSFDTETTGLKINMFGKIGSDKKRELEEYNRNQIKNNKETIRVDRLVGLIFCVEENVSYYFPCWNRKFKNLYSNYNDKRTKDTVDRIKVEYTIGKYRDRKDDMARYIRETPSEEIEPDVILMERCRKILETCYLLAHNGTFEWKVCWLYHILFNLREDTMLMHQLMYKFRSTTSNRGEPSNLKYLSKVELNVDQLDLKDFFVDYAEASAEVKSHGNKKKNKAIIDFSYMDYEGSKAYAPADGDFTLQLCLKYKKDLKENHKDLEYLYSVELLVSQAIAYMEFYGIRIDEQKIEETKQSQITKKLLIEHQIREIAGLSDDEERKYINLIEKLVNLNKSETNKEQIERNNKERIEIQNKLREKIDNQEDGLNLASPAQISELFYDKLGLPVHDDKKSVAKNVLKQYLKLKTDDGKPKYPFVNLYSDWKKIDTLLVKFFDNLPYYMYPGGFIFAGFGQISAATGRMSCSKPNLQQLPKDVTSIVVPRDGYVQIDGDFSQIEYRTLVALAPEPKLREEFRDPDMDYHTTMASLMYGVDYALVTPAMRGDAKSFNFGIPYGMGFGSLAILLTGVNTESTRAEAREKYELYFKDQPNVRKFFMDVKEATTLLKYTETKWHRRRYYSFEDKDGNFSHAKKAAALRQAGNACIQGCLHGDTRIQTKDMGIVKIKDVVNTHKLVWDGDKWSNGDILYSGKKQKCIVRFSNGQEFICSPIHKFLVKSAKGNERFVECKDLATKQNSKNPHRVVINRRYEKSDFKYSSDIARLKYKSFNNNDNNVFVDDMSDSFEAGIVLGRLASDGSIFNRDIGGSSIRQYIAEHELNISPKLMKYMKNLNCEYSDNDVREGRNEKIDWIQVYSKSLVREIEELDIKHQIHDDIFKDTEMLRGFLRGMFDGDGGISGHTITLTFGTQCDFESMCRQIQKALLFFGIRSRYYKYDYRSKITIKTKDNQKFLDLIGFINEDKQAKGRNLECTRDEHIFGQVLIPESVEITDEYIDMYDVCNTDGGYYVADGIITHNTAADIFKIAVARNFNWIKQNGLIGEVLITNLIHDEQLLEVNARKLNVQRVLAEFVRNMEMEIDGFPPLYTGAGVAMSWKEAKGKMAEIHPDLAHQMQKEAETMNLWDSQGSPDEVIKYFDRRVYEFRRQKITDYVLNEENHNKVIHPVIGSLLSLQFDNGVTKRFTELYDNDNYTKEEKERLLGGIPVEQLRLFIEENDLDIDYKLFHQAQVVEEEEEDVEYEDGEEEDRLSSMEDFYDSDFILVDEDDKLFGVDLQSLIKKFGLMISIEQGVCGIDATEISYKQIDRLADYLKSRQCERDEYGSMQVVLLTHSNIINKTGMWVKDIDGSKMSYEFGLNSLLYR